MATLGELKDRIVRETNRDDLTDTAPSDATAASAATLAKCIQRAVDYYSDDRFWFNEQVYPTAPVVTATQIGSDTVAIPSQIEFFDRLSIQVGGSRYTLERVQLTEWDRVAGYVTSAGQPTIYAVLGNSVRLWPTPSAVYPLVWVGVYDIALPTLDTESSVWTTYGEDLIAARTRFLLLRDYFRDKEGAEIARAAELEALSKLRSITDKKISTGRLRASW